jgi:hypothetical protein
MAIVDLDSHLRDGGLLDEIYQLPPFTRYSRRRIGDGKYFYSKFEHDLLPRRSMRILAKMGEFVNRRGIHPRWPMPIKSKRLRRTISMQKALRKKLKSLRNCS